jgi:hypothetical protein
LARSLTEPKKERPPLPMDHLIPPSPDVDLLMAADTGADILWSLAEDLVAASGGAT